MLRFLLARHDRLSANRIRLAAVISPIWQLIVSRKLTVLARIRAARFSRTS